MPVQAMRDAIAKVYGGEAWIDKVNDMEDDQVIAVYHAFVRRGLIQYVGPNTDQELDAFLEKRFRLTEITEPGFDFDKPDEVVQLSIYDLLEDKT